MAYGYKAALYCDDCGKAIMRALTLQGKAPADLQCESSYESDDFPKPCDNDTAFDSPVHCNSDERCLNAITLPSGRKVGVIIGKLNANGMAYVAEEATDDDGEVVALWRPLIVCDVPYLRSRSVIQITKPYLRSNERRGVKD